MVINIIDPENNTFRVKMILNEYKEVSTQTDTFDNISTQTDVPINDIEISKIYTQTNELMNIIESVVKVMRVCSGEDNDNEFNMSLKYMRMDNKYFKSYYKDYNESDIDYFYNNIVSKYDKILEKTDVNKTVTNFITNLVYYSLSSESDGFVKNLLNNMSCLDVCKVKKYIVTDWLQKIIDDFTEYNKNKYILLGPYMDITNTYNYANILQECKFLAHIAIYADW